MKRIFMVLVVLALSFATRLYSQEEGGGQVTYLSTTTNTVTSVTDYGQGTCIPPGIVFDFEPVNGDATFDHDLVLGQTFYSALMSYQGMQRYNNGSGDFPSNNGTFFSATNFSCSENQRINDVLFGKLRPTNTRRDLAILRQNEIRIYQNTGNGMATSANQTIGTGATSGSWVLLLLATILKTWW